MAKSLRYRMGQFVQALSARVSPAELKEAMRLLSPPARELFARQEMQDQRHALDIYHTLRRRGHDEPDLLAAALLHDAGKAVRAIPAWQRAMIVCMERYTPETLARLSEHERSAFAIHTRHAERGAAWAERAGCSPLTVSLIRRHHQPVRTEATEEDRLLAALQAADNQH